MVDALVSIDKDLKNDRVGDALQQLKSVKERLMNEEEFCSTLPVDLSIESRIHLDKVGYRHAEYNKETF